MTDSSPSRSLPLDDAKFLRDILLKPQDALTGIEFTAPIRAVVARMVAGGERRILIAPCVFCSYNGAGYWQRDTHAEDCPFHKIGGEESRLRKLGLRRMVQFYATRPNTTNTKEK